MLEFVTVKLGCSSELLWIYWFRLALNWERAYSLRLSNFMETNSIALARYLLQS